MVAFDKMCECTTHDSLFFPYSLKLECEKLASEKTEMQRHYVMVRSQLSLYWPCNVPHDELKQGCISVLGVDHVVPYPDVKVNFNLFKEREMTNVDTLLPK